MAFSKNITYCISVICNFRNVSPKNTFWERCKKRKCFVIKHLRFYVSQKSENYSHSRAPCAAANRYWLSTSYRVFVNYWRLFDDTFCTFLHAHGNENVFLRQRNLFLCHIFNFWFYNKLLDSGLTIVNCKCFIYSIELYPSETLCKLCLQS